MPREKNTPPTEEKVENAPAEEQIATEPRPSELTEAPYKLVEEIAKELEIPGESFTIEAMLEAIRKLKSSRIRTVKQEGDLIEPAAEETGLQVNNLQDYFQRASATHDDRLTALVEGKITGIAEFGEGESRRLGLMVRVEYGQSPAQKLIAWIQADAEDNGPGFLNIEEDA